MLVLGSIYHVPKEPCPSVSSPKRVSLLSLGGFGSRCLQSYLGAWHGMVWHGMIWYGMLCYAMVMVMVALSGRSRRTGREETVTKNVMLDEPSSPFKEERPGVAET